MQVHAEIDIAAPIDKVFSAFSDLEAIEKNITGIQTIELVTGPAKMEVGTTWKETRFVFGKEATETMWVTELTPNKSYSVEAQSNGTKYHSVYTFTEEHGSTHVHTTFTCTPQTITAKFLYTIFFFIKKSLKKMLLQDMQDVKKVCEQ